MKYIALSTSLTKGQKVFIGAIICFIVLGLAIQHAQEHKVLTITPYNDDEKEALYNYIEQEYGKPDTILHMINRPDLQLEIAFIRPTEGIPYFKLITIGAGAYKMYIPEEFNYSVSNRAEYVVYLPFDWNTITEADLGEWSIITLEEMALIAAFTNDWVGIGHTIGINEDGSPVSDAIKFNSYLLLESRGKNGQPVKPITLGNSDKTVDFFQVVPLYPEELNYKEGHSYRELMNLFGSDFDYVIDINRKNYCK